MQDNYPIDRSGNRFKGLKRLRDRRRPNITQHARGVDGHKKYLGNDQEFLKACTILDKVTYNSAGFRVEVRYEPTQRQYHRWCQRRGTVWNHRYQQAVARLTK